MPSTTAIIAKYGTMWPRNEKNRGGGLIEKATLGVYVLCDGSFPVYVGKGNIRHRIWRHMHNRGALGQSWDHFSWFEVQSPVHRSELEALLVQLLPHYLRSLNRTRPRFAAASKVSPDDAKPDPIDRPHLLPRPPGKRPRKR